MSWLQQTMKKGQEVMQGQEQKPQEQQADQGNGFLAEMLKQGRDAKGEMLMDKYAELGELTPLELAEMRSYADEHGYEVVRDINQEKTEDAEPTSWAEAMKREIEHAQGEEIMERYTSGGELTREELDWVQYQLTRNNGKWGRYDVMRDLREEDVYSW